MKEDRVYLAHIHDAIQRIESYTFGGRDQFLADSMVQDAVIRNLEVIGEAVKGLSEDLRSANPDVPWKQIAGMRNVLIHQYFGVKLEAVWQVVVDHLPLLRERIARLIDGSGRE